MNIIPHTLKTVFVLPALAAGGAERALITLMNGINSSRFNPEIIAINDQGPMRDIIDPQIPFHSFKSKNLFLSLPKLYFKLKSLKPDIVVSTMVHMNITLMLLKPFFPKTHFIIREAITPSFMLNEYPLFAPFLKIAYKILYPKATFVISPAQMIIDEFQKLLKIPIHNHTLLYNFVDYNRIRAKETLEFPVSEKRTDSVHFVAAGRLHPQKGFGRLLLALANFKSKYDWQLIILGEGPRRNLLQSLVDKYNFKERVHLPGLSPEPWPQFAQADYFLLPSRWEGLPNVVLESLACGTPVIASGDAGGINEIASFAKPGAISIAKTIDEFIFLMEKCSPSNHKNYRESLLPDVFQKETVIKRFEEILEAAIAQ